MTCLRESSLQRPGISVALLNFFNVCEFAILIIVFGALSVLKDFYYRFSVSMEILVIFRVTFLYWRWQTSPASRPVEFLFLLLFILIANCQSFLGS